MIHGFIVIRKRSGVDGPQFPVKKSVKIGRGTHCDVRIHVQSVSEQHCLLLVEKDKRAMIQNLSMTSQTLVNGVPIGKGTCALKHGDTVTVGERSFRWLYGQQTPFYEGKKGSLQKRRKSEADSKLLSQNVAVVVPMYHKRKTLGPNITYSEPKSRTPKKSLKAATPTDANHKDQTSSSKAVGSSKTPTVGTPTARFSLANTPRGRLSAGKAQTPSKTPGKSPASRTPVKSAKRVSILKSPAPSTPAKSPAAKSPAARTPAAKSPAARTPAAKSPAVRTPAKTPEAKTPATKSPAAKTPAGKSPAKSPASRTPAAKSPAAKTVAGKSPAKSPAPRTPAAKSPAAKTPAGKSLAAKSPAAKTPAGKSPAANSPAAKTPSGKSPAAKSPAAKTPVGKSPAAKSPASRTPALKSTATKTSSGKTPARKASVSKSAAKSSGKKTPAAKTPRAVLAAKRKTKSAAKALKSPKGQKRRLSSPAPVASKRLKIESPKSIDKKKMAILMDIHGRIPRVATSSTLSTVKVVLSGKKTPIVKRINTPRSSTVKKSATVKSSVKKARRPLFSEILKKKAVQTANIAAKKLHLAPKPAAKTVTKKTEKPVLSTEIPLQFKFGSTGHANSPESIFIGRKVAKTPVVTKKGRKAPLVVTKAMTGGMNLSGISEMFTTPAKTSVSNATNSQSSIAESGMSAKKGRSRSSTPSAVSSPSSSSPSQAPKRSRSTSGTLVPSLSPSGTPKIVLTSPTKQKNTPVKSPSPVKTPAGSALKSSRRSSTPSSAKPTSNLRSRSSSASAEAQEGKSTVRTPRVSKSLSQSVLMSGSKRHQSLLTSTPAVFGKRQSFAESVFESPSSVLTGQVGTPQSPASGRKSRLDMVAPRTSYVHSPHTSPIKSSLKSSPPKSPEKHLSVSFNDSIHIKTLVPGSKKSLNTTAPLSSPASPRSEGSSGIATPDVTTFDFNSVKTPNVPQDMFVSSILSSGASSTSSPALGSAKRKGKPQKSPHNDLSDVQGVKRLMKTPTSPAGYIDVKGVKRLMTAASKTPTYLAVDGVKKLFGDAAAAAGNELASFPGVQELFASPSPSKTKSRFSSAASPKGTPQKSSPVAKIQAEVENKGRSSTDSTVRENESKTSTRKASSVSGSPAKSSSTPVMRGGRVTRNKTDSARRTRKADIVSSPKATEPKSPVVESPPKRRTRKAAAVSSSPQKSPVQKVPKSRARRGATQAAKSSLGKEEETASPAVSPKTSPVKVVTKKAVPKTPSPVKTPPTKRTTRRGAKATTNSPITKASSKRALSPSKETSESPVKRTRKEVVKSTSPVKPSPKRAAKETRGSPVKRTRKEVVKSASPVKPSPKRATRKTKKEVSPKEEAPKQNATSSSRKRKAVTFEDEVTTPSKKGKTTSKKESALIDVASPEKKKTTRKAPSKKNEQQPKDASPPKRKAKTTKKVTSPEKAASPRRTRSRK